MGPLAAVERFLERLFERQSARLFRTGIRPVVVLRRLERTMEEARTRDGGRTIVPHRLIVRLHPGDVAALRASTPELAAFLADGALAFARHHAYTLLDRPTVTIRPDPSVDASDVVVDAGRPGSVRPDRLGSDHAHEAAGPAREDAPADPGEGPLPAVVVAPATSPTSDGTAAGGGNTAVFVVPDAEGPRATIREIRPDRSSRTIAFDGRPLTIGRAADNRVVLRDGRASRHHARIDARRGSLVLTDLASTNGSFVNDRRVDSIALGEGDRIRLGATTLVVESIEHEPAVRPPGDGTRPGPAEAVRPSPGG
jgi:hypothetical protein